MLRSVVAVGFAGLVGFGVGPTQQTRCGASPTEAQVARRRAAISLARQINTAEAQGFAAAQKYMPLASLKGVSVAEGFEVQVSTDGEAYTFSVKDIKDECSAAVFSDQKGVIYTGMPLQ